VPPSCHPQGRRAGSPSTTCPSLPGCPSGTYTPSMFWLSTGGPVASSFLQQLSVFCRQFIHGCWIPHPHPLSLLAPPRNDESQFYTASCRVHTPNYELLKAQHGLYWSLMCPGNLHVATAGDSGKKTRVFTEQAALWLPHWLVTSFASRVKSSGDSVAWHSLSTFSSFTLGKMFC